MGWPEDVRKLLANTDGNDERAALAELCERGLVTCTRGVPGERGSRYALAWVPLDNPEQYPESVRRRHAQNMSRLGHRIDEQNLKT